MAFIGVKYRHTPHYFWMYFMCQVKQFLVLFHFALIFSHKGLTIYPLASNVHSSCLSIQCPGITGACHYTYHMLLGFVQVWWVILVFSLILSRKGTGTVRWHRVKVLAATPDDLSGFSGLSWEMERAEFHKLSSNLHMPTKAPTPPLQISVTENRETKSRDFP